MTYDEIKAAWNVQADEHNQWDELSEAEKIEWAFACATCRPAPQGMDARVQDRLSRLYLALEVCSAELFAQCADQGRAMKYVDQARSALAAEQCARAAQAKQGGAA